MGFLRYELRTTDVERARAFHAEVIGSEIWSHRELAVAPLPERAAAMGAPSHWLGHIAVPDVAATVARMLSLGGQLLGPPLSPVPSRAVLRDPLGAVLAVTSEAGAAGPSDVVVFEHLHTTDVARASAVYAALFGWTSPAIADTARLPGVHPHWMFHFRVDELEAALARVRALGGRALEPMATPSGHLAAACEDPQGAAFALTETGRSPRGPGDPAQSARGQRRRQSIAVMAVGLTGEDSPGASPPCGHCPIGVARPSLREVDAGAPT